MSDWVIDGKIRGDDRPWVRIKYGTHVKLKAIIANLKLWYGHIHEYRLCKLETPND